MDQELTLLSNSGAAGRSLRYRGARTEGGPLGARVAATVIKWSFLLFVVSIPFEELDPFGVAQTLSVTRLIGIQFVLIAFLWASFSFARPSAEFWWFTGYFVVFILLGLMQLRYFGDQVVARLTTLAQLLVLFWLSTNMLKERGIREAAVLTLGFSCTLLVILRLTGVAAGGQQYGDVVRVAAFGQNPNSYAITLSAGLLSLVGATVTFLRNRLFALRLLCWLCAVLIALEIIDTGSRGAAAALLAGLLMLVIWNGRPWTRVFKVLAVTAAVMVLFLGPFGGETSRSRWEETFSTGDVAQRDLIFPAAFQMAVEKPLAGWGPVAHLYELGRRIHYPEGFRDPHNLFLWLFDEGGVLGAIPFLVGLWICFRKAWRARHGAIGSLPLAFITFMLVMSLTGSLHYMKLFWLALAFAAACEAVQAAERGGPANRRAALR